MDKITYKLLVILIISVSHIGCQYHCDNFKNNEIKIYGIDVSHYQNEFSKIDWVKVASNKSPKIQFAYIRSTMGSNGVDTAFIYNFKNAQINNIKVGVYHYYRPNETALKQFQNFKKNNKNIGTLPPVLDIEEKSTFTIKKLRSELLVFLKLIEEEYQTKPIIYTHQKFYNLYLRTHFYEYDFWIARHNGIKEKPKNNSLQKEPFLIDKTCPVIWQYSENGLINGVNGYVDLNIANSIFWEMK